MYTYKKNKFSLIEDFLLQIFKFSNFQIILFLILHSALLIGQNSIDQLQYKYNSGTNQLNQITDDINSAFSTIDIDNQNTTNYAYNATGQLTKDDAEGILAIEWTASGKVKQVSIDDTNPQDGVSDRTLDFKYDAMGNRVKKTETFLTTHNSQLTTFYIRKPTGEVISMYTDTGTGIIRTEVLTGSGTDKIEEDIVNDKVYSRSIGFRNYELKDHLGNVRVVISDIKEPSDPTNLSIFQSSISNSSDYYSYGALMPGRDYSSSTYRYGFQGKEKDDELKGNGNSYDFGARMLDSRVGRWLSIDPLADKFPGVNPYNAMANNPINRIDPDGMTDIPAILDKFQGELCDNAEAWWNYSKSFDNKSILELLSTPEALLNTGAYGMACVITPTSEDIGQSINLAAAIGPGAGAFEFAGLYLTNRIKGIYRVTKGATKFSSVLSSAEKGIGRAVHVVSDKLPTAEEVLGYQDKTGGEVVLFYEKKLGGGKFHIVGSGNKTSSGNIDDFLDQERYAFIGHTHPDGHEYSGPLPSGFGGDVSLLRKTFKKQSGSLIYWQGGTYRYGLEEFFEGKITQILGHGESRTISFPMIDGSYGNMLEIDPSLPR